MTTSLKGTRQLVATLSCKDGRHSVRVDLSPLLAFGRPFAMLIADELLHFSRRRAKPAASEGYSIARWGECLADLDFDVTGINLSDGAALDELHLIFLEWFFTRNPQVGNAALATLKIQWTQIGNFVRFCQARGALPRWDWFAMPTEDAMAAREGYVRATPREFIGHSKPEPDHSDFLTRIVATRSLAITTTEYLDELRNELQANIERIVTVCYRRIDKMRASFAEGERIAAQADIELLERLDIESPHDAFRTRCQVQLVRGDTQFLMGHRLHLFSPRHPRGLSNLLWWIKNRCEVQPGRQCGRLLPRSMLRPMIRHSEFDLQDYLGVIRSEELTYFVTLIACCCREAGNLSTILNLDIDGLTQAENGEWRISSVKGRVGEERGDLLDARLAQALLFLRDRTSVFRQIGADQPHLSRALFLGRKSTKSNRLPYRLIQSNLAGKLLRRMLLAEPELVDLKRTTYSMIRNTHAVIEYVRCDGDWSRVARALGNSISTSIRHYVPAEVKLLLRERRVRQHQNEMLLVASVGQDFNPLLAVDLASKEEIEVFLANALKLDVPKTNVLLRVLSQKLAALAGQPMPEPRALDQALFAVSENNLALLFRYEECLKAAAPGSRVLDLPSAVTGIAPACWQMLSSQLRALFGSDRYDNREHAATYQRALQLLPQLRLSIGFAAPW